MNKPIDGSLISVCLLTYNHVNVIESTIRSVLEQTCDGFEFIVSDDCSTDGTWELIQDLARQEPRIRPLQTSYNMHMPGNANFAVANSTRPYIALLHHDDLYRSDMLEKWAGVLDRHPDVNFVFNPYETKDAEYHYGPRFKTEKLNGSWFLVNHIFARWGCPVRGTAMIRRSAWELVGGMRERFDLLSDVDMWMRLSAIGPVGYVSENLITPQHERPDYYPSDYTKWSWSRLKLLYEIHGTNRIEFYGNLIVRARWETWKYQFRVSIETTKWLGYALVRKKKAMLETCMEGATVYDLWPVHLLRWMLLFAPRYMK